jgi:hypothetical protein
LKKEIVRLWPEVEASERAAFGEDSYFVAKEKGILRNEDGSTASDVLSDTDSSDDTDSSGDPRVRSGKRVDRETGTSLPPAKRKKTS